MFDPLSVDIWQADGRTIDDLERVEVLEIETDLNNFKIDNYELTLTVLHFTASYFPVSFLYLLTWHFEIII